MSTVEDPETTGEADLADLLPTGSIEPQVAEADPLDLSVPAGLLSSQTDLSVDEAPESVADQPAVDEAPESVADQPVVDEAELFDQDAKPAARPESPYDRPGRWFVVHTQSGYENKVSKNLVARTTSMNLEERILEVVIPMEDVVEFRSGKKVNVSKKMFPGYLLVRCHLDDVSWSAIRDTPGIVNFVGAGGKPLPLSRREVENFLEVPDESAHEQTKKSRARFGFDVGETVRVKEGPFADFSGAIIEINEDQLKVKVLVNIFGRETPVELEFSQIAQL
ncbi:MAG: transcription termination/antitermination protein NusG [Acidimicrobiales bacterium]|nr:transcription termination/antitermination protein NusG [Acidimicrobiales bacterium]